MGPVQPAPGCELRDPSARSSNRPAAMRIGEKRANTTPRAWTRPASKPRGLAPLEPELARIAALTRKEDLPALSRTCTASASTCCSASAPTPIGRRVEADCGHRPGRPRAAGPRLLPQDRCAVARTEAEVSGSRPEDARRCSRPRRPRRPATRAPCSPSKPRWRRRRSIAPRGAIRPRPITYEHGRMAGADARH